MKKKNIICLIICILLVVCVIGGIFLFKKEDKVELKNKLENEVEIVLNDNAVPKYINGKISSIKVTDESTAYDALQEVKNLYKISNVKSEFNVEETKMGDIRLYEFQQKYNNIEVLGAKLTMSVDKDCNVQAINGSYIPDIKVSTYSILKEEEIKEKLNTIYGQDTEYLEINKYIYVDVSSTKTVYDAYISNEKGIFEVVVDAKDGSIITEDELGDFVNYVYTGKGINDIEHTINIKEVTDLLSREKSYEFIDEERNIQITDASYIGADFLGLVTAKVFANSTPFTARMDESGKLYYNLSGKSLQNAITTMKYYEDIYDYYKNVLGRNSYDNKGSKIIANINISDASFTNKDLGNAMWVSGLNQMFIGNYNGTSLSLSKDVLGHEFTHGVISTTSKFTHPTKENRNKPNETGALNEAYGDIMGTLIEDKDWLITDSFPEFAKEVGRDLSNPEKYEKPSQVEGDYFFPDAYLNGRTIEQYLKDREKETLFDIDRGGEHHNSTIVSHAAYLMYNNGAFASKEEMAKVWYQSLFLLSAHSNFEDCAYAVIQSAINLGIEREKISIIKDAFIETKMLSQEFYKLSGKVKDEDEKSLEGVLVTAINNRNSYVYYETYTNKSGEYEFSKLPSDEYTISFEKAKYYDAEKEIVIEDKDVAGIDCELKEIEEKDYKKSEIVFVMDNSQSMDDNDPTDVRKQIIANVLGSLNNESRVALVTFTKDAKVINSGLGDKNVDKKIIITDIFNLANDNGRNDNSGTNGGAGIDKGLGLFDSDSKSRKYIVFLTDGDDTFTYEKSYDELIKKAKKKDVRILTIGLGENVNSEKLIKLAEETNGKYYNATTSSKLYKYDKRIFEELN